MTGLESQGVPSGCLPVAIVFAVFRINPCLIMKSETILFSVWSVWISDAMIWVSSQKPWELIYVLPREYPWTRDKAWWSSSRMRMKSNGARGHPCFIARVIGISSVALVGVYFMHILEPMRVLSTSCMKSGGHFKRSRACSMLFHRTVS